ncbi:hypothetical protein FACS1894153_3890 [Bacteroidia bacterium]|nr:hypothetical protein FACS1894153_3890 [Bacteroidia bacterium]
MNDIVSYLQKFFAEQQNEAAIPKLGVFYISNVTSTGKVLPSNHYVILYAEKKPRSNAFINYYGYRKGITQGEAEVILEDWVDNIFIDLKKNNFSHIPELGVFQIKNGKMIFDEENNVFEIMKLRYNDMNDKSDEDYGLEPDNSQTSEYVETNFREVEFTENVYNSEGMNEGIYKSKHTSKHSDSKKCKCKLPKWLIILIVVLVLVGGYSACYFSIFSFKQWNNELFSSVVGSKPIPVAIDITETTEEIEDVFADDSTAILEDIVIVEDSSVIVDKEDVDLTTITTTTTVKEKVEKKTQENKTSNKNGVTITKQNVSHFYVIGGAYKEKANAEKTLKLFLSKKLDNSGMLYKAEKAMYYVFLKECNNLEDAHSYKALLLSQYNIDSWILH